MIITIAGTNLFQCDQRLKTALDSKHLTIDLGEQDNFVRLEQAVLGESLFADNNLIVVRGIDKLNKSDEQNLIKILQSADKNTAVILFIPGAGKQIVNKYKQVTDKLYFEQEPKPYQLVDWIVKYTADKGGEVDKTTARFLIDWVGDKQIILSQEIDKLLVASKLIDKALVESLASKTPQATIFQLLDAIVQGETELSKRYYEELLELKLEPQYVMSMLCWQAQALSTAYVAKGEDLDQIAKNMGMSPFVLKKASTAVKNLSKQKLIDINEAILKLDTDIKNLSIDANRAVEQLIIRLATSF